MYMYNVSQKANISEIVILQMLGEMNLKNKKMIAGFFSLKKKHIRRKLLAYLHIVILLFTGSVKL